MSLTSAAKDTFTIQIVYALPDHQHQFTLSIHANTTAQQAIEKSTLLKQFPEIELSKISLGIFGKIISHNTILLEGDRLEIYRPLMIDPKESRRQRALLAKK